MGFLAYIRLGALNRRSDLTTADVVYMDGLGLGVGLADEAEGKAAVQEEVDRTLESIADFVLATRFDLIPDSVIDKATDIVVDTLACAIGGRDCRGAEVAKHLRSAPMTGRGARVIGIGGRYAPDLAAFWNTAMIRYLDYNDTMIAGHPSDTFGPIVAGIADEHKTGRDILTAVVISYEIHARFAEIMQYRPSIDRHYGSTVAATGALCWLRGLDRAATRSALAMSATSGVSLRATRAGQLSDYKGIASAVNMRLAIFATLLAESGLTGPSAPFDGRYGLVQALDGTAGPLGIADFAEWKTQRVWQKCYPVAYNIQPSVWAAIEAARKIDARDVERVELHVAPLSWAVSGSEPQKWDPHTRETADHSLPYAFGRAFLRGSLSNEDFMQSAFRDSATLEFMRKIEVFPDRRMGPEIPSIVGVRAEIVDVKGARHVVTVHYPRGHDANPMTRAELTEKAHMLIDSALGPKAVQALEVAWGVRDAESFGSILDAFEYDKGR